MKCPSNNVQGDLQGEEILLEYCSGSLDASRSARFEKHLHDCSECSRLVAAQKSLFETLDSWEPEEISADFDQRLYARIAQEDAEPAWKQWLNSLWKPALVTAVAGVAITVVIATRSGPVHSTPGNPQVRSEVVDMDQMETTLEELDLLTPSVQTSQM